MVDLVLCNPGQVKVLLSAECVIQHDDSASSAHGVCRSSLNAVVPCPIRIQVDSAAGSAASKRSAASFACRFQNILVSQLAGYYRTGLD